MSKIKLTRERSHFGKLEPREERRPEIKNSVDTGTPPGGGNFRLLIRYSAMFKEVVLLILAKFERTFKLYM